MKKYAILIAVEQYSDPAISRVNHARADAEQLSNALELHGFAKNDQLVLIDSQATKGVIESKVRRVINRLRDGDWLFFYYAGHGFSKGARNFISCHDTQDSDWDGTSVALNPIFNELQQSKCEKIALFLDCCESGIKVTPGIRGIYDNLKEPELEAFLDDAAHCICFAACRSHENSYSSGILNHGIWTYHLIEAFLGDAPIALERGLLTANSLQNYLASEVPRTLSKTFSNPIDQTPWMYGAMSHDALLADLRPLIEKKREEALNGDVLVTELSFEIEESEGLKRLSGWKKSYFLPDRYTNATEQFAIGLANKELKEELDDVYDALKESFGFSRRDLDVSDPLDGTGTIITPHFNYSVTVSLNPDELSEVIWNRSVDAIKHPGAVMSDEFAEVFDKVFDTLEFSLPKRIEIEDFIDAVEAAKIPELKIKHDRDCNYCQLHIDGGHGLVTLTSSSLSIVHDRPQKTRELIASFDTVRKLVHHHKVPLITFQAPGK